MITTILQRKPTGGLARRVAFWVAALMAVYVVYSATTFRGQPDAVERLFAMLLQRLPTMLAQILPPAVFAAVLTGAAATAEHGTGWSRHQWILLGAFSLTAYVLAALVEPLFAQAAGSDWQFPPSLLHAAESTRAAAAQATGREAASLLRRAAVEFTALLLPIANAVFVFSAGVLGDLTGRLTLRLSAWPRYAARWLSGGILFAAFWVSADIAYELVAYYRASPGLLIVIPLSVPLLSIAVLAVAGRRARA